MLGRAMTEDATGANARIDLGGEQRCDGHREAVDDARISACGGFEQGAGNHCQLEAAEFGDVSNGDSSFGQRADASASSCAFAFQCRIVEPGSSPDAICERPARAPMQQHRMRRRCCRSPSRQAAMRSSREPSLRRERAAGFDRARALLAAHRRLEPEITRARANPARRPRGCARCRLATTPRRRRSIECHADAPRTLMAAPSLR